MPPFEIDDSSCPTFRRAVKRIRKKHPKIDEGLQEAYGQICRNPAEACRAVAIPGFERLVWKYRITSPDMTKGSSGAFRLVAKVDHEAGVVSPLLIYPKNEKANADFAEISAALKELRMALQNPDLPMGDD